MKSGKRQRTVSRRSGRGTKTQKRQGAFSCADLDAMARLLPNRVGDAFTGVSEKEGREHVLNRIAQRLTKGVAASTQPWAVLFAGGDGQGKSWVEEQLRRTVLKGTDAITIDSNLIRENIPEYGMLTRLDKARYLAHGRPTTPRQLLAVFNTEHTPHASHRTQVPEVSAIKRQMEAVVQKRRACFIRQGLDVQQKWQIEPLLREGYRVLVIYVSSYPEVVRKKEDALITRKLWKRSLRYFQQSGRYVNLQKLTRLRQEDLVKVDDSENVRVVALHAPTKADVHTHCAKEIAWLTQRR